MVKALQLLPSGVSLIQLLLQGIDPDPHRSDPITASFVKTRITQQLLKLFLLLLQQFNEPGQRLHFLAFPEGQLIKHQYSHHRLGNP